MHSYTITIGRNTGSVITPSGRRNTQLSAEQWQRFQLACYDLLVGYAVEDRDEIEAHDGIGSWGGSQEDSHKVTLLSHEGLSQGYQLEIRHALANLAQRYGQDAIALTIGESELVFAETPEQLLTRVEHELGIA